MRVTTKEQEVIKSYAMSIFGDGSSVYIFGSRADDTKRGGDIDIYIETSEDDILDKKIQYLVELEKKLGEQRVDIVINNNKDQKPIFEIARRGVKL